MPSCRVIFMGTPEFAVPALASLHESDHEVLLVVTQPDRPKGRGKKIVPPPVKECALTYRYPIIQPESCNQTDILSLFKELHPDCFVVVAYGHILSESLLNIAPMGAINIHPSLLPKYRGPAPIQWALINGEHETGVTIMIMDKGIDTGPIVLSESEPVLSDDTAESLHDRLAKKGAKLLIRALDGLQTNTIQPCLQNDELATYAKLLRKNDGLIQWHEPAQKIVHFIQGMTPWPGAFTFLNDKRFKIYKATCQNSDHNDTPGKVFQGFPGELLVTTGHGVLSILEIQGSSGKRLPIEDFLRGFHISPDMIFK